MVATTDPGSTPKGDSVMVDLRKRDAGAGGEWRRVSLDAIDRLSDPAGQVRTRQWNVQSALVMGVVVVAIFVLMAALAGTPWPISAAVVGIGLVVGGVVSTTAYLLLNYLMGGSFPPTRMTPRAGRSRPGRTGTIRVIDDERRRAEESHRGGRRAHHRRHPQRPRPAQRPRTFPPLSRSRRDRRPLYAGGIVCLLGIPAGL